MKTRHTDLRKKKSNGIGCGELNLIFSKMTEMKMDKILKEGQKSKLCDSLVTKIIFNSYNFYKVKYVYSL